MPATSTTPAPLDKAGVFVVGIVKCHCNHCSGCLIGQIKLTRIHATSLFLPGVRVKRDRKLSLYNVERSGSWSPKRPANPNFALCLTRCVSWDQAITCSTIQKKWWSLTGSNRRHPACKAGALPAELRPHFLNRPGYWLARVDSNHRPHAYQACALTT